MSDQYVQADSRNLPSVDIAMIMEYFQTSDKHNVAEIRGVKTMMASRSGYVDSSVGYVEVKTENTVCFVRAKVVPEHKITKKYYQVTAQLDETTNTLIDTTCDGCPALAGGCKHTIVLLFWLEKRTSEPSSTSTTCYWKKPRLASQGTQPVCAKDIANRPHDTLEAKDPGVLKDFYEECKKRNVANSLITSFRPEHDKGLSKFCIFDMILEFTLKKKDHSFKNFMTTMSPLLNEDIIKKIEIATTQQSDSTLWHNIRQGRITASKVHEVCHCKTSSGSLVEQILGGYKAYETKAMKRGKMLEKEVILEIEKKLNCKIDKCGFTLINLIFGASPDGKTKDFIVEIKCPSSRKTLKNYIDCNQIKEKYVAQCQLQMYATNYDKCAFCVADPDFEKNRLISILWIQFNHDYAKKLLSMGQSFWKDNIFPKLVQSALS